MLQTGKFLTPTQRTKVKDKSEIAIAPNELSNILVNSAEELSEEL